MQALAKHVTLDGDIDLIFPCSFLVCLELLHDFLLQRISLSFRHLPHRLLLALLIVNICLCGSMLGPHPMLGADFESELKHYVR